MITTTKAIKRTRLTLLLTFFVSLIAVAVLTFVALNRNQDVAALSPSDFRAGRIIDDNVFYNENAMDANAIQSFLNARVPSCDTQGSRPASEFGRSDITRAQYAASRGWQSPPYTCLRDFRFTNPQVSAASGLCNAIGSANRSAAEILVEISRACHINPQVLLVLLQKEQSLVTDTWPLNSQYRHATGFACPDTAPCNDAFSGFFYQAYYAARQFQIYRTQPNSFNYVAGTTRNIYYNPNLSQCGSSQVYIENQATAGLYNYTPYQPNQRTLDWRLGNGPAVSSAYPDCGAFGNVNFFSYFRNWFGSTQGNPLSAKEVSRPANFDLPLGHTRQITFRYQNTGTADWFDDTYRPNGVGGTHLAITAPINSTTPLAHNWSDPTRPVRNFSRVYESNGSTLAGDQHKVSPGQIAEFTFTILAPETTGSLGVRRIDVQPVTDGVNGWDMGNAIASVDVNVVQSYLSVKTICPANPIIMGQNETATTRMRFENTGSSDWYDGQYRPSGQGAVMLSTANAIGRLSGFAYNWRSPGVPGATFTRVYESNGTTLAADQHKVSPGQIAEYEFDVFANDGQMSPGTYREEFKIILNGARAFDMLGSCTLGITVQPRTYQASFFRQSAHPVIPKGQTGSGMVAFKNTGTGTWFDSYYRKSGFGAVHLITSNDFNRNDIFARGWQYPNIPGLTFSRVYEANGTTLAADQHKVLPGQVAEWDMNFLNNTLNPGQHYSDHFTVVIQGVRNWHMTPQKVWLNING